MSSDNDFYHSPELYDLIAEGVPGDIEYFSKLAKKSRRVLELACGTGRVTIPMAKSGAKVTGIELRKTMLDTLDDKAARLGPEVRKRLDLYVGDMTSFELGQKYPLIIIPFRAFQHLHEVAEQRACLECCREHLNKTGRLVINLFDPNLRILGSNVDINANVVRQVDEKPIGKGERIVVTSARTACPEEQRFEENWVYEKFDARGQSEWRRAHKLHLRYFFRYEMEHLFELSGLKVVKLEGDFQGGPYKHGGEQIWTVKRA